MRGANIDQKLNFNVCLNDIVQNCTIYRYSIYEYLRNVSLCLNLVITFQCGFDIGALKIIEPLLHERCLRFIYSDKNSTFEELFNKDGFVTIHSQNLQFTKILQFLAINCKNQCTHYFLGNIKNMSKICRIKEKHMNLKYHQLKPFTIRTPRYGNSIIISFPVD